MSDIVERLRRWDEGRISTHYEGCWDSHPVCAILLAVSIIEQRDADLATKDAEIVRLRRWKDEATIVLTEWNSVADPIIAEMDFDDTIGRRKTDIVADEITRLRAAGDALAELERLRADALAKPGDRIVNGDQMGTIVTCPTCDGDGILHDPDEKPEPSIPEGGPS